jgi:hypothetical protein
MFWMKGRYPQTEGGCAALDGILTSGEVHLDHGRGSYHPPYTTIPTRAQLESVLGAGETCALIPDIDQDEVFAYWNGDGREGFVAQEGGGLWVGTLPRAFRYPQLGFVDAFVMYREFRASRLAICVHGDSPVAQADQFERAGPSAPLVRTVVCVACTDHRRYTSRVRTL